MYVKLFQSRDYRWDKSTNKMITVEPYDVIPCGTTHVMRLDARNTVETMKQDSRDFMKRCSGVGRYEGFIIVEQVTDDLDHATYYERKAK